MNKKMLIPWILLTPLYGFLALLVFWAGLSFFPAETIHSVKWEPKVVAAGDTVHVTFDMSWRRTCKYKITRLLYNGSTTYIGYVERFHNPGVDHNFQTLVQIPIDTPSGEYDLIDQIIPVCNLYDSIITQLIKMPPMHIIVNNVPLQTISLQLDKSEYHLNDEIVVTATLRKNRTCDTLVDTFFTLPDGTIVEKFSRASIAAVDKGTQTIREIFKTTGMKPGNYLAKRVLHTTCTDKIYQFEYTPVPFKIVE